MATDVYAGQLCATHVMERIAHPLLPIDKRWWIQVVTHTATRPTVRIICLAIASEVENSKGLLPKVMKTLNLNPDEIVTISRR